MNDWDIGRRGATPVGGAWRGRAEPQMTKRVAFTLMGVLTATACAGELASSPDGAERDAGASRAGMGQVGAADDDSAEGPAGDDGPPAADDTSADDDAEPRVDDLPPDVFADGTQVTTPPPGEVIEACDADSAPAGLLKLSTLQYRNTVRDLLSAFGAAEVVDSLATELGSIPDDSRSERFRGLDERISLEHVEGYYNVARAVGDALSADNSLLQRVAGDCALQDPAEASCLDAFIDAFGLSAFRRPLTAEERAEYQEVAASAPKGPLAFRDVVVAQMVSPRFVNHFEIDGARVSGTDDLLRLSPFEVASRLSYTFWQSMPDAELFEAAAAGELSTEAGLDSQIDRIFDDPRTRATLWSFWSEWFGLESFTGFETARPGFAALLDELGLEPGHDFYADMVEEVRVLTEMYTFDRGAPLAELLSTTVSVTQSPELARIYGTEAWDGQGPLPTVPPGSRGGLLQRSALLVSSLEQTNPFHRGAFVQRYLLCEPLPSPDPAALPPGSLDIPQTTSTQTTRERFEAKVDGNGLCSGCHDLFSDTGYALESFDSLGGYRTTERVLDEQTGALLAELPIDAAAEVAVGGQLVSVASPSELNDVMMQSGRVATCLAEQYFKFVNRRSLLGQSRDRCVADGLAARLDEADSGLLGTFRYVAELQDFYQRRVGQQ